MATTTILMGQLAAPDVIVKPSSEHAEQETGVRVGGDSNSLLMFNQSTTLKVSVPQGVTGVGTTKTTNTYQLQEGVPFLVWQFQDSTDGDLSYTNAQNIKSVNLSTSRYVICAVIPSGITSGSVPCYVLREADMPALASASYSYIFVPLVYNVRTTWKKWQNKTSVVAPMPPPPNTDCCFSMGATIQLIAGGFLGYSTDDVDGPVGTSVISQPMFGALNPLDGLFYFVGASNNKLRTLDLATSVTADTGKTVNLDHWTPRGGIVFGPDGTLYAWRGENFDGGYAFFGIMAPDATIVTDITGEDAVHVLTNDTDIGPYDISTQNCMPSGIAISPDGTRIYLAATPFGGEPNIVFYYDIAAGTFHHVAGSMKNMGGDWPADLWPSPTTTDDYVNTTYPGSGTADQGEGAAGHTALVGAVVDVAVDSSTGDLYTLAIDVGMVRKISASSGVVTSTSLATSVTNHGATQWNPDTNQDNPPAGDFTGDGALAYNPAVLGYAGAMQFNGPMAIALSDCLGILIGDYGYHWLGDSGNNRIRYVSQGSLLKTIAGSGLYTAGPFPTTTPADALTVVISPTHIYSVGYGNYIVFMVGDQSAVPDGIYMLHDLAYPCTPDNLVVLLAGGPNGGDQYGTSDIPDVFDSSTDPGIDFNGFDTASPTYNVGSMRVATDGVSTVAIDGDGKLWYLSPSDVVSYVPVVLPSHLTTANQQYSQGIAWHNGTWWLLLKEVNEIPYQIEGSFATSTSIDIGIFVLTSTTLNPTDPASWVLYRTIQANSGSVVGVVGIANDGVYKYGVFTDNIMTGVGFVPMVIRFADGTGIVTADQSVNIPGTVAGTFTVGVNRDGTFVVNGGEVTFTTVTVGNRPSTWNLFFNSLFFWTGGGPAQPANVGSTVTMFSPDVVTTPDGDIGGMSGSNTFFTSLCAPTGGMSISGVPTDPLAGITLRFDAEYLYDRADHILEYDYRNLVIHAMGTGNVYLDFFMSNTGNAFTATTIGELTLSDHGLGFGGGNGGQDYYYACMPTIVAVPIRCAISDIAVEGIGAGGVFLMVSDHGSIESNFDGVSILTAGVWQYVSGHADPINLTEDITSHITVITGRPTVAMVRFDGNQNVPVWAGGVIVDSAGVVDSSTSWLGVCDDGANGLYAVTESGDLVHRAGDHTHSWTTVVASLTGAADTVLLLRLQPDDSILCVHGSAGTCQVDTILAGIITIGTPFAFPTDEFNTSVRVPSGSSSYQELESAFATAAGEFMTNSTPDGSLTDPTTGSIVTSDGTSSIVVSG